VIYLDDLTFILESNAKHIKHLKTDFERCRKFRISFNPNKSIFSLKEGKLLGHIISKEGITVEPKRVSVI